ncbi:hypothetical protein SESBI_46523 [Sesbania bispinosa]|nr:hypothetical protein SESBI_46523 [Sesbania bispinosa]
MQGQQPVQVLHQVNLQQVVLLLLFSQKKLFLLLDQEQELQYYFDPQEQFGETISHGLR